MLIVNIGNIAGNMSIWKHIRTGSDMNKLAESAARGVKYL